MSNTIKSLLALVIITITLASCGKEPTTNPTDSSNLVNTPQRYIVVLTESTGGQIQGTIDYALTAKNILESHNISNDNTISVWDNVIKGFCANLTPAQVNELKTDNRISYIEKDQIITIDDFVEPVNPKESQILVSTQYTPWGVRNVGGSVTATTTSGIAWIIDTGIDFTHPDLNVNTTLAKTYVSGTKTANDDNGHGSHVSGIIAAKDNSVGVVGVCSGAQVVPIKVLDKNGSGYISNIISGINYVANNYITTRINVVNMSFGGGTSTSLDQAVGALAATNTSKIFICIAAGNSAANANYSSPARVNGVNIYTISAYDSTGKFAYFSNYGNPPVDYAAPGVNILSTYKNGGYMTLSGTSMATPHVCGILLATGGKINYSGNVTGDKDNTSGTNEDKMAHE